jgi:hypothetical protein
MGRRRRTAASAVLAIALSGLATVGVSAVAGTLSGSPATVAPAGAAGPLLTAADGIEPVLGLPASNVVVIGASPQENQGEVWAYGVLGAAPASGQGGSFSEQFTLLQHTDALGWQVMPLPSRSDGEPLSPHDPSVKLPSDMGPLAGRTTTAGGVVLLTDGGIVTRDPGAQPQLVPDPTAPAVESSAGALPTSSLLGSGESLPPHSAPEGANTPFAAVEEPDGHNTGVLIAPYDDGVGTVPSNSEPGILHYDGEAWTREQIAVAASQRAGFTPEALACGASSASPAGSSPENCWLLAAYEAESGAGLNRLGLYRRTVSSVAPGYAWTPQLAPGWLGEGTPPANLSGPLKISALSQGAQMLTATAQGVWVDLRAQLGAGAPVDVSQLLIASPATREAPLGPASVAGSWCFPTGTICPEAARSLGAPLPAQYQSFAWPGSSSTDPGERIISGLPHGVMLEFSAGRFSYALGAGGDVEGAGGAAFVSSGEATFEGWTGNLQGASEDRQGQAQVIHLTPQPQGDQLQASPVPFRYPLLAVAQMPGSTPADPGAQALAVGLRGQVGRFIPGQGWRSESLYDSSGEVQTPTLRGVAWPEPGRAYAVGDNGAMWLWRADTGLWEPDPAKPLNFIGNLTAVAFSAANPALGYAVGKNGALLRFGKSWTQETSLPPDLAQANFTSVAFAGEEALATYRAVAPDPRRNNQQVEVGGVAINDGSGWQVDPSAAALLSQLPDVDDTVLSKVAGLPDGGVAAAGPGLVIERDTPAASWRFSPQPLPEAQNVSALAAYRDSSGLVRAVVSLDLDSFLNPNIGNGNLLTGPWSGDVPPPSGPGQPPPFPPADPIPDTGYLLKETASGWSDLEHAALPASNTDDMPARPDPLLAVLVDPSGGSGLAVGGQTYDSNGTNNGSILTGRDVSLQTATAVRFGAGLSSEPNAQAPISTASGAATFAVGGDAACSAPCAEQAAGSLGPDVSLTHALQSANQIAVTSPGGLRGFLYTGGRLPASDATLEPNAFERELTRFATLLGSGGTLPVHVAASPGEQAPGGAGIGPFLTALGQFAPGSGGAYYSFVSTGSSGGPVMVIVLDYSTGALGAVQQQWLEGQLTLAREAREPAIVMGDASLGFTLPDSSATAPLEAQDAAAVSAILVRGGASAYLFDYPEANVHAQVVYNGLAIPAFGTGTLGYVVPPTSLEGDSLGSSGYLLVEVQSAARNPATNVTPVTARVEPNIGQLALGANDGVLLRRSQVALFEGLARRPSQGVSVSVLASGEIVPLGAAPYEPIPFNCLGSNCADALPTEYVFTSSNPDVGDFVAHDPTSINPRQVRLGANQLPVPDASSGIFCAYNAGTTIVSITAGGLTYSEPVTVQSGSVEYPCGTVPLKNPPRAEASAQTSFAAPELPPANSPPPVGPRIQSVVPPPLPITPKHPKPHPLTPRVLAVVPFVPLLAPVAGARGAIVPPPAPPVARPIPPSGTSQVTQAVPEEKREEESATELASSSFLAYDSNDRSGPGAWPLMLVVLAAAAGIGVRRGRSSNGPKLALAHVRSYPRAHRSRGGR